MPQLDCSDRSMTRASSCCCGPSFNPTRLKWSAPQPPPPSHISRTRAALPLVQQALEHVDFRIRLAASVSFTRMDYETAKPLIVKALQSRDPLTRSNAYQVIGRNRDASVASEVIAAVGRERDLYAKAQGLWTIGRIGGAESVPQLLDMLAAEEETVRHASAEALVFISDRLLQQGGRSPR